MNKWYSFLGLAILFYGCSQKTLSPVSEATWQEKSIESMDNTSFASRIDPYYPDSKLPYKTPNRYIKVNVHFTNSLDKKHNLTGSSAIDFAENLIEQANKALLQNHKMNLPVGNSTPVDEINYQYVFWPNIREGIIFDYDDQLFYTTKGKNQYNRDIIKSYGRNEDEVLNIFIMPQNPDSLRSETYGALNTGVALGNNIKINGDFIKYPEVWRYVGTLNHEVGHVLGLVHSWGNDPCDDTPKHPNCWEPKDSGPCAGVTSNNMMDYNNKQNALTPCQLAIINRNFNITTTPQRKILMDTWCQKTSGTIHIDQNTTWKADMDIRQDVVVKKGVQLQILSEINFAENTSLQVEKGGSLILGPEAKLYNSCGKNWRGVISQNASDISLIRDPNSKVQNIHE